MTGFLTTHVLDTSRGLPAAGLQITLYRIFEKGRAEIAQMTTNADGRTDAHILPSDAFELGEYELVFHTGPYLNAQGHDGPQFLSDIPIRFIMDEQAHFHVPLLLSPYGYSTYRGS